MQTIFFIKPLIAHGLTEAPHQFDPLATDRGIFQRLRRRGLCNLERIEGAAGVDDVDGQLRAFQAERDIDTIVGRQAAVADDI